MTSKIHLQPALKLVAIVSILGLSACASKPRTVRAANLTYEAVTDCSEAVSFDNAVKRTDDEKKMKKEMRSRIIHLKADMADVDVPCLTSAEAGDIPYQVFEIPTGVTGRVVTAGAKLDTTVIFAGDITTHDSDGEIVRQFDQAEYRRLGSIYGVQFSPRSNESHVLIKANPTLVGERDATIETDTRAQNVTFAYGGAVSSGTNTVGVQRTFDRTYSYNGEVSVRTVFPKQEKK